MSSLQVIQYDGPPKAKRPSQRPPSKIPSRAEHGDEEGLTTVVDEVEVLDLAWLGRQPFTTDEVISVFVLA